MKIRELNLSGVLLVEPDVYADNRGFFLETWRLPRYLQHEFPDVTFVQDNHSRSVKGVLRGLHYQRECPQGKLVQVIRGRVFDVAVDVRVGSPNFGNWVGHELSDDNHCQMWIPAGFAHGFCVLSELADVVYKCTDYYRPDDDFGVIWSDPDIAVRWPVECPLLSNKDKRLVSLDQAAKKGRLPVYDK